MVKLSKKIVKEAIKGSKGIITNVAKVAGVQRKYIYKYINKYPDIKEALQEERDKLIDVAEEGLIEKLEAGENWAIALVLKTLGKDRGYVERTELKEIPANIPTPSEVLEEIREKRETKEIKK